MGFRSIGRGRANASLLPNDYANVRNHRLFSEAVMTIALIGALAIEVAPLLAATHAVETGRRLGQPVYRSQIEAHDVLIAEIGMGKVRAAAVLQALIEHNEVESVICFG